MLLKKYVLLFSICLFINSCTNDCDNHFEGKPFNKEIIAFYPSWRMNKLPIKSIPWQHLTRIIYAFAAPLENGSLETKQLKNSELLVKTAHKNGVEVYFAIGGGGGKSAHFPTIAIDPIKRKKFVKEIVKYTNLHCFDGVDIDWEYLSYGKSTNIKQTEQEGLIALLSELRVALKPTKKTISIDVYGSIWGGRFFLDRVVDHVDQVHIMAYDFSGKWSDPKPHSSIEQAFGTNRKNGPSGIYYWLNKRKWARDKLFLGVPFYGRDFNHPKVKGVPYREIVKHNPDAVNLDRYNDIFYNGQKTMRHKAELVIQKKLPGVMIWELTQDAKDDNSLLKVLSETLNPE